MSLKKKATTGLVWTYASQFGDHIITFVVSVILARILLPAEFGLIGMISIFIGVGKTLIDSGLTSSLIRSSNPGQDEYSTVFYFNLAGSFLIYFIIFFAAPFVADFYGQEILIGIIRLYCLTFIIDAFKSVQRARLTKNFDFKTQTLIAIPANILGGITGVTLAYQGFGVWSLVWAQLAFSLCSSVQFWFYSKWIPSFTFNYRKFKEHFNYGFKLTLAELLNTIFKNIYLIVIGRYFSAAHVGYYSRAYTLKQLPVNNISNALNKVTFPLFASIENDDLRLKRVFKQIMQMVFFITTPSLIILGVLAEPLIIFLFTEKWIPAIPYFQILCIIGVLQPVQNYNLNILKVKGRSDLVLKIVIINKLIITIMIILTLPFGIIALLLGQVVATMISFFINSYYSGKLINYNTWEQLIDIFPVILIGMVTGLFLFIIQKNIELDEVQDILILTIGVITGFSIYLFMCYVLRVKALSELVSVIRNR